MRVANLSTGKIVLLIKDAQHVAFSKYEHVLVNDNINARQPRWKPYWEIATLVVWILEID